MYINYPFTISGNGRISLATQTDHLRQLIEEVLLTMSGERVNRPDLGSGLMQMVFAPNNHALTTTFEFLVQGALQAYLGNLVRFSGLTINNTDTTFSVSVQYTVPPAQQQQTLQINTPMPMTAPV